jgi:hypothetical protein
MRTIILLAMIIAFATTLSSCSAPGSKDLQANLPPRLVDQPNPVDPQEQANKFFFHDLYKSGVAKTAKEMLDLGRVSMRSGELPVGSGISPGFYVQNLGGPFKGVRVTVDGSAIDQGILCKPEMIIESSDSAQSTLNIKDAISSLQCVQVPETTNRNGMVVWTVDAKKVGVASNAQLHIALNCQTAKLGTADFVFTVYASENPTQSLIRHNETVFVRGWTN